MGKEYRGPNPITLRRVTPLMTSGRFVCKIQDKALFGCGLLGCAPMPESETGEPTARSEARSDPRDEELMAAAQAGDDGALTKLIARYRRPLYGFLWRRANHDVDDLFQETWLRVVRSIHRFDTDRRFSTWLFQIANNLCRDRGRRGAADRRKREAFSHTEKAGKDHAGASADALDATTLLTVLSDLQREVVVLRYYQQRSEAETAEILDIPKGTVKSRLHAAITAMRREVSSAPDPKEDANA